jgi:hypothetical protein
MTCALCFGSGNLMCSQNGQREWWPCVACGGSGARVIYGPPTIRVHALARLKGVNNG